MLIIHLIKLLGESQFLCSKLKKLMCVFEHIVMDQLTLSPLKCFYKLQNSNPLLSLGYIPPVSYYQVQNVHEPPLQLVRQPLCLIAYQFFGNILVFSWRIISP